MMPNCDAASRAAATAARIAGAPRGAGARPSGPRRGRPQPRACEGKGVAVMPKYKILINNEDLAQAARLQDVRFGAGCSSAKQRGGDEEEEEDKEEA